MSVKINAKEIYEELKKSVVGQDEYLRKLAILGYKHQLNIDAVEKGLEAVNCSLLIVGESGSGKTHGCRQLAKILDVPFYEVDSSSLTQESYKGRNVSTVFSGLIEKYRSRSKQAIVFLDEFDKVLDENLEETNRGKGAMPNFLKLLEKSENIYVELEESRHTERYYFDSRGVTFIAAGTFENVKEKIRKEKQKSSREGICAKMGFNSDVLKENENEEIILTADDIIRHGFLPELLGRFSQIINLRKLDEEDFYNIIKNGKNNCLDQFVDLLSLQRIELEVKEELFRSIARKAYEADAGARGINRVLNDILEESLFEVSNDDSISKIIIGYKNGEPDFAYEYNRNDNDIKIEVISQIFEKELKTLENETDIRKIREDFYRNMERAFFIKDHENRDVVIDEINNWIERKRRECDLFLLSQEEDETDKTYQYAFHLTRIYGNIIKSLQEEEIGSGKKQNTEN